MIIRNNISDPSFPAPPVVPRFHPSYDIVRNLNTGDPGYSQDTLRIAGVIIVVIVIAFILVLFALLVCSKVRSLSGYDEQYIMGDRGAIGGGIDTVTGGLEYTTTTNGNNVADEDDSCCSDSFYCKPISSGDSV
jgi:hypothetical protein